ncbi:outer membrane beta-barrel protein [Roseivirga sp.]|uniref:type IX secretion/gliding motility protein PorT/SprT n=1 Tax=Roseivirga sp. TaxID=1964215 RepID=UPI003B8D571F
MQTFDIWNKLNLHRTKIIVVALLIALPWAGLQAQSRKSGVTLHRLDSDQKTFKYGFLLGVHNNSYGIQYSERFDTPDYDQTSSITSQRNIGFDLGFMVNLRLADQLSIRVVPVKIGLYQNTVEYQNIDGTIQEQLIESTRIEPGIFMKYRSIRRNNTRMYLIAGISGSIRSGKEDLVTNEDRLEIRKANMKFEVGIGIDNYFEFFKFSPEFRYARGLSNVMNMQDNFFHNGLNRISTHSFTLYLHFSD